MHRISHLITRIAFFAPVLISAALCGAQGIVTGSISGTVQDPSAAVVPGASVTAIQKSTNSAFRTTSSATGTFLIPGLPVDQYTCQRRCAGVYVVESR